MIGGAVASGAAGIGGGYVGGKTMRGIGTALGASHRRYDPKRHINWDDPKRKPIHNTRMSMTRSIIIY